MRDYIDGLRGIGRGKDIHSSHGDNIYKMLQAKEAIAEETRRRLDKRNIFGLSLNMLSNDLMKDYEFDEEDLNGFINVCSIVDKENRTETSFEGYTMGFISAAFLELLNLRNKEKGKGTRVEIDGNKNRFNYLFQKAKTVDELIIRNLYGYETCDSVGGDKGYAKTVALIDIQDKFMASDIGFRGRIDNLILIGNSCELITNYYIPKIDIELVIAIDNKSVSLADYINKHDGRIRNLVLVDNNIRKFKNIVYGNMVENLIMGDNIIQTSFLSDEENKKVDVEMKNSKANKKKLKIVELTRSIDKNNTEQMFGQIERIREELENIR